MSRVRPSLRVPELLKRLNEELHARNGGCELCSFTSVTVSSAPDVSGCNWESASLKRSLACQGRCREEAEAVLNRAKAHLNVWPAYVLSRKES